MMCCAVQSLDPVQHRVQHPGAQHRHEHSVRIPRQRQVYVYLSIYLSIYLSQ